MLLDCEGHIRSWFALPFSKYESSLPGTVLCAGTKIVNKRRHSPSQGGYNQIIPKINIKVQLYQVLGSKGTQRYEEEV